MPILESSTVALTADEVRFQRAKEKTAGFINFFVYDTNGKRRNLGVTSVKLEKDADILDPIKASWARHLKVLEKWEAKGSKGIPPQWDLLSKIHANWVSVDASDKPKASTYDI